MISVSLSVYVWFSSPTLPIYSSSLPFFFLLKHSVLNFVVEFYLWYCYHPSLYLFFTFILLNLYNHKFIPPVVLCPFHFSVYASRFCPLLQLQPVIFLPLYWLLPTLIFIKFSSILWIAASLLIDQSIFSNHKLASVLLSLLSNSIPPPLPWVFVKRLRHVIILWTYTVKHDQTLSCPWQVVNSSLS